MSLLAVGGGGETIELAARRRTRFSDSVQHLVGSCMHAAAPRLVLDRWSLAVVDRVDDLHRNTSANLVEHLHSPTGLYLADPIPVAGATNQFLVEAFDLKRRMGSIWLLARSGESWLLCDQHLNAPGHLSYPYTFVRDGQLILMCESIDAGHVSSWALEDNGTWKSLRPLADRPLADPTVIKLEDGFVVLASRNDGAPRLVAYATNDLLAPWGELSIDARLPATLNRPGGAPLRHEGSIYVPLQDDSRGYGSGIVWCTFSLHQGCVVLEPAGRVDPPHGFVGLHTIAPNGSSWLVDLRRYRPRLSR